MRSNDRAGDNSRWPPGPLRWPAEALTDGVVVLDRLRGTDAPLVARACDDPVSARWLPLPSPYTEEHAHQFIASRQEAADGGDELTFAVRDRVRDVVGAASLHVGRCRHGEAEIGYWTAPWARDRGVATRATRLVAAYGFTHLQPARIELLVAVGNEASRRAALTAGAREEGVRRDGIAAGESRHDAWVLSLLPVDLGLPSKAGTPRDPTTGDTGEHLDSRSENAR